MDQSVEKKKMTPIQFTVYGSPIAQPRARSRAVRSKSGKIFAQIYEPETCLTDTGRQPTPAMQWKTDIKTVAVQHRPDKPLDGPLSVAIDFYLPRPRRFYRKKDPDGRLPHVAKPDRDNAEKAVLDSLTGIIFVDDCQVCAGEVRKFWHEKDRGPRAEITIGALDHEEG